MTLRRRLGYGGRAMLAGWLVALVTTLPFQVEVARRNGEGDARLTLHTLGLGMLVWSIWTFLWAVAGLMALTGPVAVLVSPRWLILHRRKLILWIVVASLCIWIWKFQIWKMLGPLHDYDTHIFWLYLTWTLSYSLTTLAVYLRLVRRVLSHSVHEYAARNRPG